MTEGNEERTEPQRPRVVDKRVSARRETEAATDPEPAAPGAGPADERPPDTTPRTPNTPKEPPSSSEQAAAPSEQVWTPEQEAEAQRLLAAMQETPALDWVLNSCVTLANVAGIKIEGRDLPGARLAIDGLAAMIDGLGTRLGEAETPLRRSLSQLQMAYAQVAGPPPPEPTGS